MPRKPVETLGVCIVEVGHPGPQDPLLTTDTQDDNLPGGAGVNMSDFHHGKSSVGRERVTIS